MKDFFVYFNQGLCRSCDLMESDYADQVSTKESILLKALKDLGPFKLLPTQISRISGFRNKAKLVVTGSIEVPIIGLTGDQDLDQGKEILKCPVHHPRINEVIHELKKFIQLAKLTPYNIKKKTGELKGMILFYSEESEQMYLRFILRSKESIDRIKKNGPLLLSSFSFLKTMTANIKPIPHAILEGPEEVFILGQEFLQHKMGRIELSLHPRAFVQTNQLIAQKLYETAAAWIKEIQTIKFCELFCGQGAFSMFAAGSIKEGLGIEINPDAVESAKNLGKKYKFHHLKFLAKDAADVETTVKNYSPDTVLVNPPRKGLGKSIEIFKGGDFEYIIYSSCSWQTLAEDLKNLTDYKIIKAQIFDMFPHTNHFETLVLLQRR
jgi:23S rRNA (uracil747-C5)-methyltransferase